MAAGVIGKFMKGEGYGAIAPPPSDRKASELTIFKNITYIVVGIVIRNGEVLMMQEAKMSCRGKWYLPAGRMEKNESIEDAVKREVAEETGLEFKPKSLIAVELLGLWIRYTVIGDVVGGELKTEDKADGESLQAGWYPADVSKLPILLPLRAPDILPLIECGLKWMEKEKALRAYERLPILRQLHGLSVGVVAIWRESSSVKLLKPKTTDAPLPLQSFLRADVACRPFLDLIQEELKAEGVKGEVKIAGILSLEHDGRNGRDGLHLDVLVEVSAKNHPGGEWTVVEEGPEHQWIVSHLEENSGCIELIKLR